MHTDPGVVLSCEGHTELLHACRGADEHRSTRISLTDPTVRWPAETQTQSRQPHHLSAAETFPPFIL